MLEDRTHSFGGIKEFLRGIGSALQDLAADVQRRTEGFTAFVTPGVVGKTAELSMCQEDQHEGPESLGQRLSSLHTGQMALAPKRSVESPV